MSRKSNDGWKEIDRMEEPYRTIARVGVVALVVMIAILRLSRWGYL